jgi:hypothetical protein
MKASVSAVLYESETLSLPYLDAHFVSADQVRNRLKRVEPNVAMTAWEGASFEKRELAAVPVRWLGDLPEDEIADIYAILERPKPG